MTSPGGNVVEIRVRSVDETGPGFSSATKKARDLAAAVDTGAGSAGKAMDSASKKAAGFAGSLKRIGEVAGGVLLADMVQGVAQRATQLIKSTVKAASDLGESVNAVNKTFGSSAQVVQDWGEQNAASFGLSTRAFNQMATPLGAMLKNQGLAMQEVSNHTIKLTERAADMASVFNTDVQEALVAIQAGLRGESDPLERFGVGLSAAAVDARALADSGKTATAELTAQEKALARLNLIYDQTASTAGDFRDTSDGLANAQRIATAQIENAQAKVGGTFIPIFAKAAQITGDMAAAFGALPGPIQTVAAAIVGVAAAAALLAPRIVATKAALDQMALSANAGTRALGRIAVVGGKAAGAFAVLQVGSALLSAAIGSDLNPQLDAAAKGLTEFADKGKLAGESARIFGEDAKDLEYAFGRIAADGFEEGFDRFSESVIPALSEMGTSMAKATERVTVFDQALAQMVRDGHAEEAGKAVEEMARRTGVSIERAKEILPAYAGALETGAGKTDDLANAAKGAAGEVEDLKKELESLVEKAFEVEEAEDAVADAAKRLKDQLKEQREEGVKGAGMLTGNTQAARDNRDMVRDMTRRYETLLEVYTKHGKSTKGIAKDFQQQLEEMGITREEARRYTKQVDLLRKGLENVEGTYNARIKFTYPPGVLEAKQKRSGGITGAAGGGARGGLTMVGEDGPELVDLPYGSTVIPNGTSREMMRNAGGGTTDVRISLDPGMNHGIARALMEMLRVEIRSAGGTGPNSVQRALG